MKLLKPLSALVLLLLVLPGWTTPPSPTLSITDTNPFLLQSILFQAFLFPHSCNSSHNTDHHLYSLLPLLSISAAEQWTRSRNWSWWRVLTSSVPPARPLPRHTGARFSGWQWGENSYTGREVRAAFFGSCISSKADDRRHRCLFGFFCFFLCTWFSILVTPSY